MATAKQKPAIETISESGNTGWMPAMGATTAAQDRRMVPYGLLFPSPLNPRKHFDDAELRGLAQTIAAEGVMQNLTVRPAYLPAALQKDGFEIAAGERRWRAIGWLIAEGHTTADYLVPVVVKEMTDEELVTVAMIENLDRDDLTDLELARGFAVMAKSMTTEIIATKVGKSPRFVQQRLNLIQKAAPELVQALDDGKIGFSQARGAVFATAREQAKIVKEIAANPDLTEQAIKTRALGGIPNVSAAFFDKALYTGEIVRDDDTGAEYFADVTAFARLQREAAAARAEALKAEGVPFVWLFDYAKKQFFNETQYAKKPGHAKAGVAIEIRINHHVVIHRDLVPHAVLAKDSPRTKAATSPSPGGKVAAGKTAKAKTPEKLDPRDSFTPAHRVHAHMRKTAALQIALMDNAAMAKRLLCFTLLLAGGDYTDHQEITHIGITTTPQQGFKDVEVEGVPAVQETLAKLVPDHVLKMAPEGVWRFFVTMDEKKVDRVLAALVAEQCGTWCMHGNPLDDAPLVVAVAQSLNLDSRPPKHAPKHGLGLEVGDLEGLRKPALLAVARELKAPEAHDGMTADQIRDVCAHRLKKGEIGFILPTLRFAAGEDMDKACRDFVEGPIASEATRTNKNKPIGTPKSAAKPAKPAKKAAKPAAKTKKKK